MDRSSIFGYLFACTLIFGIPAAVAAAVWGTGYVALSVAVAVCLAWGYFDIGTTERVLYLRKEAGNRGIILQETNPFAQTLGDSIVLFLAVYTAILIIVGVMASLMVAYPLGIAFLFFFGGAQANAARTNLKLIEFAENAIELVDRKSHKLLDLLNDSED